MTRMTGPDCAVMCNLINIHTYMHIYIHTVFPTKDEARTFDTTVKLRVSMSVHHVTVVTTGSHNVTMGLLSRPITLYNGLYRIRNAPLLGKF